MDNDVLRLKNEITAKNIMLEVEKENFAKQLKNGLGEEIKNNINKPIKLSWWQRLKVKYTIWKYLRKEKKRAKAEMKKWEKNY